MTVKYSKNPKTNNKWHAFDDEEPGIVGIGDTFTQALADLRAKQAAIQEAVQKASERLDKK